MLRPSWLSRQKTRLYVGSDWIQEALLSVRATGCDAATMQYLRTLCSTLPTHWNNQCFTLPHVFTFLQFTVFCQLFSHFFGDVAISRQLISIRRQLFVYLFLKEMSGRLASILLVLSSIDSCIHIIVMSSVSISQDDVGTVCLSVCLSVCLFVCLFCLCVYYL